MGFGGNRKVRIARLREFAEAFFDMNPGASQRDCLKAVNNSHLEPIPNIINEVHTAYLKKLAEKTNVPAGMILMAVLPAKHEPVIPSAARHVTIEVKPQLPKPPPVPKLPPLSLVPVPPPPKKELPVMAVTDTPPATATKLNPEKQALADALKQLRLVMDRYAIESLSIVMTSTPKPHVEIDVDYKKADKWSIDL